MVSTYFRILLLCSLALTTIWAHGDHCWVDDIPVEESARDQARMKRIRQSEAGRRQLQRLSCTELCDGCITIDANFHAMVFSGGPGIELLPHPPEPMALVNAGIFDGLTPDNFTSIEEYKEIIRNTMTTVNNGLAGTPFRINFTETISTTKKGEYLNTPMTYRIEMTELIGTKKLNVLDVYLCYTLLFEGETKGSVIRVGTSSLPSHQLIGKSDGIWVRYDTMAGGGLARFDKGITLLHEIGHWSVVHCVRFW